MNSSKKLLAVALAMLLSGCATASFEPASIIGKPCPPLAEYTQPEQSKAADELDHVKQTQMPPCVLCLMMDDYGLLRDQCRNGT